MAELSLAAVSITFQIFAGCVTGYQLLSEAKNLGKEYQYLRLRIHTEKFRLLDWAKVAGLSPQDSTLRVGRATRGLLLSILEQQHELLAKFGRYDDRLSPMAKPFLFEEWSRRASETEAEHPPPPPDQGEPEQERFARAPEVENLLDMAINFCRRAKSFPLRLRWAAVDKAKIETLIVRLSALNDFLRDTLNTEQAQLYLEFQERTCYQIMHLNSTIDQLVDIVMAESRQKLGRRGELTEAAALDPYPLKDSDSNVTSSETLPTGSLLPSTGLGSLARVKAADMAIKSGILTVPLADQLGVDHEAMSPTSGAISPELIQYLDAPPEDVSTMEFSRTEALLEDASQSPKPSPKKVWIEWTVVCRQPPLSRHQQRLGPARRGTDCEALEAPESITNRRLSSLLALFRSRDGLASFQAARCLGFFFRDIPSTAISATQDGFCGLVFESPHPERHSPVSLYDLLHRGGHGGDDDTLHRMPMPSLGQRVEIAKALACFLDRWHAVGWIHKGLRSFNILFSPKHVPTAKDAATKRRAADPRGSRIDTLDLANPLLTGFYFSRPNSRNEWTQKGYVNPAHDIYAHPQVQLDAGRQDPWEVVETFKRIHDIYSLGIVLLEVVYWKPIDVILGIDLDSARLRDTMRTRRVLLEEDKYLEYVRTHAGDALHGVIVACLTGAEAFGLPEDYEDARIQDALTLQAQFHANVVHKLRQIRV